MLMWRSASTSPTACQQTLCVLCGTAARSAGTRWWRARGPSGVLRPRRPCSRRHWTRSSTPHCRCYAAGRRPCLKPRGMIRPAAPATTRSPLLRCGRPAWMICAHRPSLAPQQGPFKAAAYGPTGFARCSWAAPGAVVVGCTRRRARRGCGVILLVLCLCVEFAGAGWLALLAAWHGCCAAAGWLTHVTWCGHAPTPSLRAQQHRPPWPQPRARTRDRAIPSSSI